MKISFNLITNLKTKEVIDAVEKAANEGLADTVAAIAGDAVKLAKKVTSNNARSIKFEVGPGKEIAKSALEGAIYSTSGYGGYQETGLRNKKYTFKPYLKPALDMHIKDLPKNIKAHLE